MECGCKRLFYLKAKVLHKTYCLCRALANILLFFAGNVKLRLRDGELSNNINGLCFTAAFVGGCSSIERIFLYNNAFPLQRLAVHLPCASHELG